MSLTRLCLYARVHSFPRVSGDEPRAAQAGGPDTLFSPRERG